MARPDTIPTAPSGPSPSNGGTSSGGSSSSGGSTPGGSSSGGSSGSSGGSSSSGGGGGGGGDPYGYRKKAADRYQRQADNLQAQADALLRALRTEFKGALRQRLQNVNEVLLEQDSLLTSGYSDRLKSLAGSKSDNDVAEAGQTNAAANNRNRERNSAVSEAMAQGAGESDLLAAQQMSLRNWNANQNEVNRSLYDTIRSINSSLTDLNVDTLAGRTNLFTQANADKDLLYTNYYNQRSESLTQLGNIYGQQADLHASAQEYGAKYGGDKEKRAAEKAFMAAAKQSGMAWDNPGVPDRIKNWDGRDDFKAGNNMSRLDSVATVDLSKKPEGATLREW